MNFGFLLSAYKTFWYSFLKRKVDRIIEENLKKPSSFIVFGLNGSFMNYYNSFYPLIIFFQQRNIPFVPLEYHFREEPDIICQKLTKKIHSIMHSHSYKNIFLIGHSFGGLIARLLVTKYLGDRKDITLVTVSAVNAGLDFSNMNFSDKKLHQLLGAMQSEMKGSDVLRYLTKNPLKKAKLFNIAGEKDAIVPLQSSSLGRKKHDLILEGEDHLSILYSEKLFNSLLEKIIP